MNSTSSRNRCGPRDQVAPELERKVLEATRRLLRTRHYAPRTEKAYVLAKERSVSASTQNQAAAALLFPYRDGYQKKVEGLGKIIRAKHARPLPVVLNRTEIRAVLEEMEGVPKTAALLLYGSELRLGEALRLRVIDVDLERCEVVVRQPKGNRDRVTKLPRSLITIVEERIENAALVLALDRRRGANGVALPMGLRRK